MTKPTLFELQKSEIILLQSQSKNTIEPVAITALAQQLVIEMIGEVNQYILKNGLNERAELSRSRLIKLMDYVNRLDRVTTTNHSLKLNCNFLFTENYLLKKRLSELESKLETINKSFDEI